MDNQTPRVPRRQFKSEQERKSSRAEQQKKYDQAKIKLGKSFENWEAHKNVCGGSHQTFAEHLIALHEAYCPIYIGATRSQDDTRSRENLHTIFDLTNDTTLEATPERPAVKRRRLESPSLKGLDLAVRDNEFSPIGSKNGPFFSTPFHKCPPPTFEDSDIDADDMEIPAPVDDHDTHMNEEDLEEEDTEEDVEQDEDEQCYGIGYSDLNVSEVAYDPDWDLPDLAKEETAIGNMTLHMSLQSMRNAPKCLAFNECLIDLVERFVGSSCAKCQHPLAFTTTKAGTCLVIRWQCPGQKKYERAHTKGSWASQPRFENMWAGNMLTPTCLGLSGNSYQKLALFAKFLKLGFISESSFYRVQKHYLVPAVKKYWQESRSEFLNKSTEPMVLAGDGRNDSPGFCAKYCTYTLMDNDSKKVVDLQFVDCRQSELKSTNMEKRGFILGVKSVTKERPVKEIITDANIQIKCLMRTDVKLKKIVHQFDMWHVSRNITKKLRAAGQQKGCDSILKWIQPVTNHLWHCAEDCRGDTKVLKATWSKFLYHATNVHVWVDTDGRTSCRCSHPIPLPEGHAEREWIKPKSRAHSEMKKVLMDPKFLEKFLYMRNFRHTSELELFNSHILMYCPKRHAFSYEGYKLRNTLAALDYNHHLGRPQAKDANGKPRYAMHFSKATRKWTAHPISEPKRYDYIDELIFRVLLCRIGSATKIAAPVPLSEDNPLRLQPRTASVPQPPKEQLIQEREERDRLKAAAHVQHWLPDPEWCAPSPETQSPRHIDPYSGNDSTIVL